MITQSAYQGLPEELHHIFNCAYVHFWHAAKLVCRHLEGVEGNTRVPGRQEGRGWRHFQEYHKMCWTGS